MTLRSIAAVCFCLFSAALSAQDFENMQIHGFATQGFLYSKDNNYLISGTNQGSADWDEAVLTFTDRPMPRLRIGIQLHYFEFGDVGNDSPTVDWALGDYTVNSFLGIRAGKVKIPLGLFNDTQDLDPVLLWSLLPQGIYAIDNRNLFLSHYGGEVYGSTPQDARAGKLNYRIYAGPTKIPLIGGYGEQLANLTGLTFTEDLSSKDYGVDLRWTTPWKPLLLGAGFAHAHVTGTATTGSLDLRAKVPVFYGQFESGKWYVAGEYRQLPVKGTILFGPYAFPLELRPKSWYAMAAFRPLAKLQVGTYYSHFLSGEVPLETPQNALNNSKDFVVSGRYDINANFYAKAETHFLHGEAVGYYANDNPLGLRSRSNLIVARLGFSF